jgi:hypothetical protein
LINLVGYACDAANWRSLSKTLGSKTSGAALSFSAPYGGTASGKPVSIKKMGMRYRFPLRSMSPMRSYSNSSKTTC